MTSGKKTKKRGSKNEISISKSECEQFSPTSTVACEEHEHSIQQSFEVNKKVNDICKSLEGYYNQWTTINREGTNTLKEIVADKIKIQNNSLKGNLDLSMPLLGNIDQIDDLQKLFLNLEQKFKKLEEIYKKWGEKIDRIQGLIELNNLQMQNSSENNGKRNEMTDYSTSTVSSLNALSATSEKMFQTYRRELDVKETIIKTLGCESRPDILQFMEASWTYEPYIDDEVQFSYTQMLIQCKQNFV